jgi:hypothetical protein
LDLTLNNRFFKGELVNLDPNKKVKPLMVHYCHEDELRDIEPTIENSKEG